MSSEAVSWPAFGEATLSNCEQEQIHLAGCIQPHGALLLVREPDFQIVQTSKNASNFFGIATELVGRTLPSLEADIAARLRPHLGDSLRDIPRGIRCHVGAPARPVDVLVHRPSNGGLLLELEWAGPPIDLSGFLARGLQTIVASASLRTLCDETVRLFKSLAQYDRVMVYRFDATGHGEVFSEECEPHLEEFLGNRYPATDIPHIARRLYERNRVRVLVDVDEEAVPLAPKRTPIGDEQLDMSLCFLRSSSPIHIQYLKNMGVRATLVVSLLVNGKLWGLVACHHYAPRFVHFEIRAVCELLAEAVATRISALQSFAQLQAELSVRILEQRLIRAISREGDWRSALFDRSRALLEPVASSGAALLFDGEVRTVGEVPSTASLRNIGRWLDSREAGGIVATHAFGEIAPEFASLKATVSGLLALPLSPLPGEYLFWVRPERIQTVTWGGNPFKKAEFGDDPLTLSPRRSFAQWHQLVEGTSDPWTLADLAAARLTAEMLSDVIIQFRSVRTLIVADQLAAVRSQVAASHQPVIVADSVGNILDINPAFLALIPQLTIPLAKMTDLLPFFKDAKTMEVRLRELIQNRLAWRCEVELTGADGSTTPLLIRADPVFTAPDRNLGFVLLCTDLTQRRNAEVARRRFQEGVLKQRRPEAGQCVSGQLDTESERLFRNHISTLVENAQLTAMEIGDRIDLADMPEMLESVRQSVERTSEVLRYLLWHATAADEDLSSKHDTDSKN